MSPPRQWCPHPSSDTPSQCHQPMAAQPPVPCHPPSPPMRAVFSVTHHLSCLLPSPPANLPTHHQPPLTYLLPPSLPLFSPLQSNEWSEGRQLWLDNQFACGHSVPQEPVGQRPRHSYSLSPDARPQIQMSSINLFLQEEPARGRAELGPRAAT